MEPSSSPAGGPDTSTSTSSDAAAAQSAFGARSTTTTAPADGDGCGGGLVFGEELPDEQQQQQEDHEEVFSTPLAVTRASSLQAVPESPAALAFHSPEEERAHPPTSPSRSVAEGAAAPAAHQVGDAAVLEAAAAALGSDAPQSGLLSLHELAAGVAHAGSPPSEQHEQEPGSPSAASTSSSSSGHGDAAAAALASLAVADDGGGGGSSSSTLAVGWDAAAGPSSQPQQQQESASTQLSPPCSPGASGLDRAASWQLQHAAAAAAGTAAHPAPPRSDIDLTKLSNTPASPHGEAGWAAWQRRRRHFFVLTAAGKPVYSRHGDEQALAGFMAVIQALLSVITDQGDVIHSMRVGASTLVFLVRDQLYLVAVSSRDEAEAALRRQLELLYQSIVMAVTAGVQRLLQRSPGYDVQQLLSGSQATMNALVSGYGDCPGWMFGSIEPATATGADRQALSAALQQAVKAADCLYGVLLVGGRVTAVERGLGSPAVSPVDLLLLANFVGSNESLRHNDETFVPVCLPHFQPNALVHAYVKPLLAAADAAAGQEQQQQQQQQPGSSSSAFLVLLSGSADAFHRLSAAQHSFVATVGPAGSGVLGRAQAAALWPGQGRVRVEALPAPLGGSVGSTPLWHATIRYPQRHQHITLAYPPALFNTRSQVKQVVRSYCRLHCAAYAQVLEQQHAAAAAVATGSSSGQATGSSSFAGLVAAGSQQLAAAAASGARPHKLVWVSSSRWATGVLVDRDVEVYATLDPLTDRELGLKFVETLRRLFADKGRRGELLVPGL